MSSVSAPNLAKIGNVVRIAPDWEEFGPKSVESGPTLAGNCQIWPAFGESRSNSPQIRSNPSYVAEIGEGWPKSNETWPSSAPHRSVSSGRWSNPSQIWPDACKYLNYCLEAPLAHDPVKIWNAPGLQQRPSRKKARSASFGEDVRATSPPDFRLVLGDPFDLRAPSGTESSARSQGPL